MADNETPNRSANRGKTEGERWTSDPDTAEVADRYAEGVKETNENTGGISNRELSEEIDRQRNLPERGSSRRDHDAGTRDEAAGGDGER